MSAPARSTRRGGCSVRRGWSGSAPIPRCLHCGVACSRRRPRAPWGGARAGVLGQAAEAYGAAGTLSGATYHLINAATLWRLSGDTAAAQSVAVRVLDSLDRNPDEAETPYWLGATRAEALLLLGRTDAAHAALGDAVRAAPRAWEDHAVTLRQFRLICEAQGEATGWLEALRPPRAAHFAGHMSLAADDDQLRGRVREALADLAVGFGFGALAAGADILVAEELAARGAELNLILPSDAAVFREASVARQGGDWGRRYDALLQAAATVQVASVGAAPPDSLSVHLAAELAMGQAAMRAGALQTEAVQILVLDPDDAGREAPGGSGWARDLWAASGRRQVIIPATREGRIAAAIAPAAAGARLAALLAVAVEPDDFAALADVLQGGPAPAAPPAWTGTAFRLAYAAPLQAAEAGEAIRAALGVRMRIGGAYGILAAVQLPGIGGPIFTGAAAELAPAALASTPPGAFHVTGAFAAAVSAGGPPRRLDYVGDLGAEDAVELFALRP